MHFGDDKYSRGEINIIRDLNFDLEFPSMFRPIESFIHVLKKKRNDKDKVVLVEKECKHLSDKVFYS